MFDCNCDLLNCALCYVPPPTLSVAPFYDEEEEEYCPNRGDARFPLPDWLHDA